MLYMDAPRSDPSFGHQDGLAAVTLFIRTQPVDGTTNKVHSALSKPTNDHGELECLGFDP